MPNELWRLGAAELAALIRRREVSSREAMQSCLGRLDAVNPRLNAVVDLRPEEALAEAEAADRALAHGEAVGALHGVPVTIKVNVDQRGFATTNGIVANKDLIAAEDSPVVANLRRVGAVPLGRTNTPAFSMRWFTDNDAHGRTLNPLDPGLTPGGSSGGAAAAVAAGLGPIAHGNDQGGSIRYPAYACGVFGLRPSPQRVPAFNPGAPGERPPAFQITSVQGPLARSVADLRLAFDAMAARDARDPSWVPAPLEGPTPATPLRVGLCRRMPGFDADPAVASALDQAARWLEDAGYRVEEIELPLFREAHALWFSLTLNDTRLLVGEAILRDGDRPIQRAYEAMLAYTKELDLRGYLEALASRMKIRRAWSLLFQQTPLVLMPVSWRTPFAVDEDQRDAARVRAVLEAQSPLLATAMLGTPGVSVPLPGSRPVGVQLVADAFREDLCLAAAAAIERRTGAPQPVDPA